MGWLLSNRSDTPVPLPNRSACFPPNRSAHDSASRQQLRAKTNSKDLIGKGIRADSVDQHWTPLCCAEYFRTRRAAFKPMIKYPGRNSNFLTTLSKVTCGKLRYETSDISMTRLSHCPALFVPPRKP